MRNKFKEKYSLSNNKNLFVSFSAVINYSCGSLVPVFLILCLSLTPKMSFCQHAQIYLGNLGKDITYESFFEEVEKQTDFTFVYVADEFEDLEFLKPLDGFLDLEVLLRVVLIPVGFDFVLYRNKIIVRKVENFDFNFSSKQAVDEKNNKILLGRVLSDIDASPLVGAKIFCVNNHLAAISDKDGYYNLRCKICDTLIVSAFGYANFNFVVGEKSVNDFVLAPKLIALEEVNVIGYGEEQNIHKIGAVSSISANEMGEVPNTIDEALAGTVPGLWFQKSSGVPGGASTIAIRGVTSLQADANSPLIVLDGVPLFSIDEEFNKVSFQTASSSFIGLINNYVFNDIRESTEFHKNGLSMVNPEDIASFTILKDAYSTSIYGSRGAAGVILINTKKPKKEGLKASFLYETSVSSPVAKPDLMNANQYSDLYSNYYSQREGLDVVIPSNINTNWYDLVTRKAVGSKVNLSIQNKTNNGYFYMSFSKFNQESYIIGSDYKRVTGRLNLMQNIHKRIKFGANITMSVEDNN